MSTIDLAREDLAKIIRGALVENWSCYETAGKWDEDVLLTGCKKVGNGQGYQNPEQAAQNLALDAADAILSALRASTQGGEEPILVAKNATGEVRAMMRIDGDDCQSVAETLQEWHATDPKRRLQIVPAAALSSAPAKGE